MPTSIEGAAAQAALRIQQPRCGSPCTARGEAAVHPQAKDATQAGK